MKKIKSMLSKLWHSFGDTFLNTILFVFRNFAFILAVAMIIAAMYINIRLEERGKMQARNEAIAEIRVELVALGLGRWVITNKLTGKVVWEYTLNDHE